MLMILLEIMSRVYVEEEIALFESLAKRQMIGTTSYYRRQVITMEIFCILILQNFKKKIV